SANKDALDDLSLSEGWFLKRWKFVPFTEKCFKRKHKPVIASEIMSQLKSEVIIANASIAKIVLIPFVQSMTDMQISSMNAMQSIICLADTLKELKTRCEAINDVAKTIASVMKAQKEKGAEWHKSTRPDIPITSFFIKRIRAQLTASKTLTNDAVALVLSLMQTIRGADGICSEVHALMNSVSTEWQMDEEKAALEVLERAIEAEERHMKTRQPKAKIHLTRNEDFQASVNGQHEFIGSDHAFEADDQSLKTNSIPVDDTV
uniref:Polyprotein n=1 Tax=Ascaris lumbricoides TaxID=6252 RepID=A0A0M3HS80_ASCLU